ncbi:hypothetical protein [Vibrio sp. MA40-2]|uniref:hypothetical protein n=1 Tax=Vibrio sp. MA40-2 TaxID=3391828 RepID=UPI0039A62F11
MSVVRIPTIRLVEEPKTWKNKFTEDEWLFYCPYYETYFKQNVSLDNCVELWSTNYKEWILHILGNGFIGDGGAIHVKWSRVEHFISRAKRIAKWCSDFYPNTNMVDFTEQHIHELLTFLFKNPTRKTACGSVLSYSTMLLYNSTLYAIAGGFKEGLISDGIASHDFIPDMQKNNLHPFLEDLLEAAEVDEYEWMKGGTLGTVPWHIAAPWLAESIEIIDSNKTAYVIQLFLWTTNADDTGLASHFKSHRLQIEKIFHYLKAFNKVKQTGFLSIQPIIKDKLPETKLKERQVKKDLYLNARYQECCSHLEAIEILKEKHPTGTGTGTGSYNAINWADRSWKYEYEDYIVVEKKLNSLFPESQLPFDNMNDVEKYLTRDVRCAVLVIMLCLSGARSWSEIGLLTFNDVAEETEGITRYSTPISKTDHGKKTPRYSTNLISRAASILESCMVGPDFGPVSKDAAVFSRRLGNFHPGRGDYKPMAGRALARVLELGYEEFVVKYPELTEDYQVVSAHQFRHAWAEFLIRRFDGNVQEVIRRQFLHSLGSFMTSRYTFAKLEPEVRDKLVSNYLKEVLYDIAHEYMSNKDRKDIENEFQGKAIRLFQKTLKTQVFSIEDIESWVEREAKQIVQIQGMEYGWCILKASTAEHAQCYDEVSNVAIIGSAKFDDCSGCVHSAVKKSNHLAGIKRQAISHQSTIKRFKERFPHITDNHPLIRESQRVIDNAISIIKRWESEEF